MSGYTFIFDAPGQTARRLPIAQLGDYHDKRYGGEFSITRQDVECWRRNLEHLPGKRALIDLDHRADRSPRNTEAAGWITDIGWDGDTPVADVEWTPIGEQAITEKRYLFFSPTYGPHKTEDGEVHDNTLIGGALTNRPFLRLPAITLASEETLNAAVDELLEENSLRLLDELSSRTRNNLPDSDFVFPDDRRYPIHDLSHARNALARSSGKAEEGAVKAAVYKRYPALKPAGKSLQATADSRPPDMDTAALIKTLELDDTADDTRIIEAITELRATAQEAQKLRKKLEKNPLKSLEQQADERGLKILDGETFSELNRKATAGETAMKQLHSERFDRAFEKSLAERKVTPSERDSLARFYELDSEATLKLLDERQPILPDRPTGDPTIDLTKELDSDQLLAARVHPDSAQLDQMLRRHMLEKGLPESDYPRLLDQYINNGRLI